MSKPSWIGQTLSGRYKIEEMLGQGGMSAVYKAYDPNLKRVVAVKLVHQHLSDDQEFVKRFEEEASTVASLRHPNIVQVYDFNADQGINYMVMEFVPGETLQQRLKRLNADQRRMPVDEALQVTINICDALSYAHKRGMVHRDIKPANIMLDVTNQAILMDFGIVKIIGGSSHTVTGAVMGTARYMPPEVVRSEPADQRSDIYALGITLYEMLSGKPPFESDSVMTVMMMHLNDPVPDMRSLRADIDPRLVQVTMKALAKDRNQRFQTADEFSQALKKILSSMSGENESASDSPATIIPAAYPVMSNTVAPVNSIGSRSGAANPPSQPNPVPQPQNVYASTTSSGPYSAPHPGISGSQPIIPPKKNKPILLFGVIGGVALLFLVGIIVVGGLVLSRLNSQGEGIPTETQNALVAVSTEVIDQNSPNLVSATNTQAPVQPTATSQPTATNEPTVIPMTPTTALPDLYVRINEINLNSSNQFEVAYETFGFTEVLPGMHIHFFFDTVAPENAGMPGSGPWILYGGPRPFTGYTIYQKPRDATQMCALVANANHTIILESGNCVDLPEN